MPVGGAVRWTIGGVPVERWLPTPGSYVVKAKSVMGGAERTISISFE